MKLNRTSGERRRKAREVLVPREEPMETLWDPRDVDLLSKWVTDPDEDFNSDTSRFAVWDLQVIAPERVPQIRRYREQYARDYANIGVHSFSDSDIAWLTTNGLQSDLLFSPIEVRKWITDTHKNKLHELINQQEFQTQRDFLQVYALLFPQKINGELKKVIVEEQLRYLRHAREDITQNAMYGLISELSTIRLLLDPSEYEAVAPSPEEKRAITHYLRQLYNEHKHRRRAIGSYPRELYRAILALADEVKVTDQGVEVRFANTRPNASVPLPDREV